MGIVLRYLLIFKFLIILKANQKLKDFSRIQRANIVNEGDAHRDKKRQKKSKMYFLKIPDYFSYDICTSLGFLNQQSEEKLPCHHYCKIYGSHEKQICEAIDLNPNSLSVKENKFQLYKCSDLTNPLEITLKLFGQDSKLVFLRKGRRENR